MLTQQELDEIYVDSPAAAKILKVTPDHIRFLCGKGRLKGALKLGTSGWLIPRQSLQEYKPMKRGVKKGSKRGFHEKDFLSKFFKQIKS